MESLPRKKLGLVLGGGGARGLAHIGVLKVLARAGIQIDMMAGTSMGGVIATMYAAGITPEQIEAEALRLGARREQVRLVDLRPSMRGLMTGGRIYNLLARTIGSEATFSDLKIPVALAAVDLQTGREVTFKEGKVVDAVRATISIPGVFVPVEQEQFTLVDGGVLNNVPVNLARELGAEVIVAVDVIPSFHQNQPGQTPVVVPYSPQRLPKAIVDMVNIVYIMISAMTDYQLKQSKPDLVLRPDLPADMDIILSFNRPIDAIKAGEQSAENALPAIQALLVQDLEISHAEMTTPAL
jgi:NTE family protein